mgnify:CR=1 FL=1
MHAGGDEPVDCDLIRGDVVGVEDRDTLGGERVDLCLLGEQAGDLTVCRDLELEPSVARLADGARNDTFGRSEVFYVHVRGSPFVFTATTRGIPPDGRSITVTDAGLVPIR